MLQHDAILVGSGIASLMTACCIVENSDKDICIVSRGHGGTPYIAAFNAVLDDNPKTDSPALYADDMYKAGYCLGNRELIDTFSKFSLPAIELLERWGVRFAEGKDYKYLLRHCSGSSVPRSLCRTDMLIGDHIVSVLVPALKKRGVKFYDGIECVRLLTDDEGVCGVTAKSSKGVFNIYSRCTVLGWGGVGNLYKDTTYPDDVDGRSLSMAYEAGAGLVDLEFVEFEPMVVLYPKGAKGEPCPTAMLGEGGHLLNNKGERFLLKVRPQGEAGAPKSLINNAIAEELKAGNGNEYGGVYADLRHIDQAVLKAYPWFYNRLINNGVDPNKDLIVVGPVAHSHSGGVKIGLDCQSGVKGLYAVGEAAGGMHGACRMAGNACTQAAVSGYAAGMAIAKVVAMPYSGPESEAVYTEDLEIRNRYCQEIRDIVSACVNKERRASQLEAAIGRLEVISSKAAGDTYTGQLAESAILLAAAALERNESRGTHNRVDFPQKDSRLYTVEICKSDGRMRITRNYK